MPKERPRVLVHAVGLEVGGVGAAAAHAGQVVALAAGDLRVEDSQQGGLQVFVAGQVEADLVRVEHPVQGTPDFAAVEFFGALIGGQAAQGGDDPQADGHVSIVLVGGVMGVDDLRVGGLEEGDHVDRRDRSLCRP